MSFDEEDNTSWRGNKIDEGGIQAANDMFKAHKKREDDLIQFHSYAEQ